MQTNREDLASDRTSPAPVGPRKDRSWLRWAALTTVLMAVVVCSGILWLAIVNVRAAANRANCLNNLRQIGLSLHNFHDVNHKLPPALGTMSHTYGPENKRFEAFGNVFYFIIPYVESSDLWKRSSTDHEGGVVFVPWKGDVYKTRWKIHICPADAGVGDGLSEFGWAYGSYAYNAQVFATTNDEGVVTNWWGEARFPDSFQGGMSNKIMIAEKFARCGIAGTLWADWNPDYWQPGFAIWNTGVRSYFQMSPAIDDGCDPLRASTAHDRGMQVCLADASARSMLPSPVLWWTLCRPNEPSPSGDW
jgi:hypothetical protein